MGTYSDYAVAAALTAAQDNLRQFRPAKMRQVDAPKFHTETNADVFDVLKPAFEYIAETVNSRLKPADHITFKSTTTHAPTQSNGYIRTLALETQSVIGTREVFRVDFKSTLKPDRDTNGTAKITASAQRIIGEGKAMRLFSVGEDTVLRGKKTADGVYVDTNNAVRAPAKGETAEEINWAAYNLAFEWAQTHHRAAALMSRKLLFPEQNAG